MARKVNSSPNLASDLQTLGESVSADLFLPSLRENPPRLRGHAFRYYIVLPMNSSDGKPVFTVEQLSCLYEFFDTRFGGCSSPNTRSGAPLFGEYKPDNASPVRDYHTFVTVYANPIDPSEQLFRVLKEILRRAPLIPQDEILIERTEVFLV